MSDDHAPQPSQPPQPSEPPDDDGPLTDIEQAVVRALAAVIVEEILEAEAAAADLARNATLPAVDQKGGE